ncbi:hypothetical protein KIH23_12545, partial [Flavobacterium sp. CYK-55]|nr:hypothetical protein [Flavobacterium sp. CYK-55]
MKKNLLLTGLMTLTFWLNTFGQVPTIEVSLPTPSPACNSGDCTSLTAVYPNLNQTTTYTATQVTYAPNYPFTGGFVLNASADDVWSPVFNLPFNFVFYGNTYNKVIIGSNGVISFDIANAGGFCPWAYTGVIPSAACPIRNAIFGVYQDTNIAAPPVTNPLVQNVNYYVLDTGVNAAPNRVFVANWNQLPQYSCGAGVGLQTSQIVLHEGTNIIEVIVKDRTCCAGWNGGNGIIGTINSTGTVATPIPGHNGGGCWASTNQSYQFTPSSPALVPTTLNWLKDGAPFGTVNENPLNVCPTGPATYTAIVQYTNPNGSTFSVDASISVDVAPPLPILDPQDIDICTTGAPPYVVNIDQNAHILNGVPSPTDYAIKYYTDATDAQNDAPTNINFASDADLATFLVNSVPTTIYVRMEDLVSTGCYNIRPFVIDGGAPSGTISYGANPYCNNITTPQLVTENSLSSGGTYSATPPGLIIDPNTGAITPYGSTVNTYTVTYEIAATATCPVFSTTAQVQIEPCSCSVIASTNSQNLCVNTILSPITYTTTNGIDSVNIISGVLPTGISGNLSSGTYTLSGVPSVAGVYTFTVEATSGVDVCTSTTTITVDPAATMSLSASSNDNQTLCVNTAIAPIVYNTTNGVTSVVANNLPTGVTGSFSASGDFTISGSPSATGVFNYTVTSSGGCGSVTLAGTITVNPDATITHSSGSTAQIVCINTAITNIVYNLSNVDATGATVTGLPAGVNGVYNSGVFTISGTPSVSGVFPYTVTTSGLCATPLLSGSITVDPDVTLTLNIAGTDVQTLCVNSSLFTPISYNLGNGATGVTAIGLPTGITGVVSGNTYTLSGIPTATGIFNYSLTTTGGCSTATQSGTITVDSDSTIVLSSSSSSNIQTVCTNESLPVNIVYTTTHSSDVTSIGLPPGMTGVYSSGTYTISGSSTTAGVYN